MSEMAAQILAGTESSAPVEGGESAPVEGVQTEKKPDARLDLVAKMERRARQDREMAKREKDEASKMMEKFKGLEDEDKLWAENPLEILKRKGWDYEKLSDFAVKHTPEEDLDPVQRRFKDYDSKIEQMQKSFEEKLKAAIEEKEKEYQSKDVESQQKYFRSSVKGFLSENKDNFELLANSTNEDGEPDGDSLIYDLIAADIQRQQQAGVPDDKLTMMEMKQAAELVEAHLEKNIDSQLERYLKLNKIKSRIQKPEEKGAVDWSKFVKDEAPKTLSNSFTSKSPKAPENMTMDERVALAEEMMRKGMFSES